MKKYVSGLIILAVLSGYSQPSVVWCVAEREVTGNAEKTVSGILGHYSAGFTLDIYAHVTQEMRKDAADRMGELIAQAV